MTPEDAKDLLPIIEAFANGATIQVRSPIPSKWGDLNKSNIHFNQPAAHYRIKPAPITLYLVWEGQQMYAVGTLRSTVTKKGLEESFPTHRYKIQYIEVIRED